MSNSVNIAETQFIFGYMKESGNRVFGNPFTLLYLFPNVFDGELVLAVFFM